MTADCTCRLCGETISAEDIIQHMEDEHDLQPERWEDGEIVIIDQTLEPKDFTDADD